MLIDRPYFQGMLSQSSRACRYAFSYSEITPLFYFRLVSAASFAFSAIFSLFFYEAI